MVAPFLFFEGLVVRSVGFSDSHTPKTGTRSTGAIREPVSRRGFGFALTRGARMSPKVGGTERGFQLILIYN